MSEEFLCPTYAPAMLHDPASPPARNTPQDALVTAAIWLFCRNGIRSTGIDSILAQAGVSRMTLYNRFGTKEGLIEAALRQESAQWRGWLFATVLAAPREAQYGRIGAIFKALAEWFARDDYFGCLVMKSAIEFWDNDSGIRAVFDFHKRELGIFLEQLCIDAGLLDPARAASCLTLLIDGAIIKALLGAGPAAAREADDLCRRGLWS